MRWLAVLLIGCYAPAAPTGAPCDDGHCPSGQTCIAERCVADDDTPPAGDGPLPPLDACELCPPGDRDGDGVLDDLDNCADVANPEQFDEDADALGDACDPCPPFAGAGDTDGDGVGDPCDPRPNVPGDRIVEFVGFAAPLPPAWSSAGSIMLAGGDAHVTATGLPATVLVTASPQGAHHVLAEATLDDHDGTQLAGVGVIARHAPGSAGTQAMACQLTGTAGGQQETLRLFDTASGVTVDTAPFAVALETRYLLHLRRDDRDYRCAASKPETVLTASSMFAPPQTQVGLRIRSVTARYHWIMIVAE